MTTSHIFQRLFLRFSIFTFLRL